MYLLTSIAAEATTNPVTTASDGFAIPAITAGTPIVMAVVAGLGALIRYWFNLTEKARKAEAAEQKREQERLASLVATLTDLTKQQNVEIEKVRHNVQNSHSVNLRDDLDTQFESLHTAVDRAADAAREAAREAKRANTRLDRQGREIKDVKSRLDGHIDGQ